MKNKIFRMVVCSTLTVMFLSNLTFPGIARATSGSLKPPCGKGSLSIPLTLTANILLTDSRTAPIRDRKHGGALLIEWDFMNNSSSGYSQYKHHNQKINLPSRLSGNFQKSESIQITDCAHQIKVKAYGTASTPGGAKEIEPSHPSYPNYWWHIFSLPVQPKIKNMGCGDETKCKNKTFKSCMIKVNLDLGNILGQGYTSTQSKYYVTDMKCTIGSP